MEITIYFGGSCAVSGIDGLGECKNAAEAMRVFCRKELGRLNEFTRHYTTLACHYVFSAGPEVANDRPGGSHHSKDWVKYGTEFAAYIVANKLGTVGTSGQWKNTKYHETTTAQAWVWHPNQKAMEKWWTENCTPKVKKCGPSKKL
jgi:hypothetical protein